MSGIEADAPGIAQAGGPDLVGPGRRAGERIVDRDRVVARRIGREIVAIDVDPQDLAEQDIDVLGIAVGIVGAAAVADRDIEIAVRAEGEGAAIVVGEVRVRNGDDGLDEA